MSEYDEGKNVKVTVVGEVRSDNGSIICVKEQNTGRDHYFYKSMVTDLAEVEAPLIEGQAYVDGDGDVVIYRREQSDPKVAERPWVDGWGVLCPDEYVTRPVRLLN